MSEDKRLIMEEEYQQFLEGMEQDAINYRKLRQFIRIDLEKAIMYNFEQIHALMSSKTKEEFDRIVGNLPRELD